MEKFNKDLNILLKKKKGSNTSLFTKFKYDQLISHVNQLKKNEPNDYALKKKI